MWQPTSGRSPDPNLPAGGTHSRSPSARVGQQRCGAGEACAAKEAYLEVEAVFQGATGQEAIDEAVEAALGAVAGKVHDVWVTEPASKVGPEGSGLQPPARSPAGRRGGGQSPGARGSRAPRSAVLEADGAPTRLSLCRHPGGDAPGSPRQLLHFGQEALPHCGPLQVCPLWPPRKTRAGGSVKPLRPRLDGHSHCHLSRAQNNRGAGDPEPGESEG